MPQSLEKVKFYQTYEFKALDKEWKAKLKKAEFTDIEEHLKTEYAPLQPAIRTNTVGYRDNEAIQEYLTDAMEYFYIGKFSTALHKKIWGMHAEGISYSRIAKACKTSKNKVFRRIKQVKEQRKLGK